MKYFSLSIWFPVAVFSSLAKAQSVNTATGNLLTQYGFPLNLEIFSDTAGTQSTVQWLSEPNSFDAPHVFPINDTTYQWWWFDVLSPDAKSSLTFIFFTATANGFALLPASAGAVSLVIDALLPNGSQAAITIPAEAAVVGSGGLLGNGVAGDWVGAGGTFAGSPDNSDYVLTVNTAGIGGLPFDVQGTLTFNTLAPPHYGSSTKLTAGQDLHVIPHLGWSNALPGAQVTGSMTVAGETMNFNKALGYHDQNWGDYPFAALVQNWYWGHFQLGPYIFVVFDGIASNGQEYANSYVANNGVELVSAQGVGSATIRPVDLAWPPHIGTPAAAALTLNIPISSGQTLAANATYTTYDVENPGIYTRGMVNITGTIGGTIYTGIGMFEQFTLS